jgi:hypothetical protein
VNETAERLTRSVVQCCAIEVLQSCWLRVNVGLAVRAAKQAGNEADEPKAILANNGNGDPRLAASRPEFSS